MPQLYRRSARPQTRISRPRNRGFTFIELTLMLFILSVISTVVMMKYINLVDEAQASVAEGFIGALQSALRDHAAEHYVKGTPWITSAAEVMGLLAEGYVMPEGMEFKKDTWKVRALSMEWKFTRANDARGSPPWVERTK